MPTVNRIVLAIAAGILGAVKALFWLTVGLVVGVVLMRAGLQWYASGTFVLLPTAVRATTPSDVAVFDAAPSQRAAIQDAVASLRYRLPPHSVTFGVTEDPMCMECGGSYTPAFDLIQIYRPVVDQGGASLRQAVAHEIGHYVDLHHLTDSERARFKQLRGIPSDVTWHGQDEPWQNRPGEDFAEVFAVLNIPTVLSPIQTSYGQVRNPAVFERFLQSAGVVLDQTPGRLDWRSVLAEESAFFMNMLRPPAAGLLAQILVACYVAYFGLAAMVDAWHKRGSTAPGRRPNAAGRSLG